MHLSRPIKALLCACWVGLVLGLLRLYLMDLEREENRQLLWRGCNLMRYEQLQSLVNKGTDLNDPSNRGSDGETILMREAQDGHIDAVRNLLRLGADIHAKGD